MITKSLTVRNPLGVHLRLASLIAQAMRDRRAQVELRCGGVVSNARNVLGILMLGAAHGKQITVVADGEDEAAALESIEEVMENPPG